MDEYGEDYDNEFWQSVFQQHEASEAAKALTSPMATNINSPAASLQQHTPYQQHPPRRKQTVAPVAVVSSSPSTRRQLQMPDEIQSNQPSTPSTPVVASLEDDLPFACSLPSPICAPRVLPLPLPLPSQLHHPVRLYEQPTAELLRFANCPFHQRFLLEVAYASKKDEPLQFQELTAQFSSSSVSCFSVVEEEFVYSAEAIGDTLRLLPPDKRTNAVCCRLERKFGSHRVLRVTFDADVDGNGGNEGIGREERAEEKKRVQLRWASLREHPLYVAGFQFESLIWKDNVDYFFATQLSPAHFLATTTTNNNSMDRQSVLDSFRPISIAEVKAWAGDFSFITNPFKYAARLSLALLSQAVPALLLSNGVQENGNEATGARQAAGNGEGGSGGGGGGGVRVVLVEDVVGYRLVDQAGVDVDDDGEEEEKEEGERGGRPSPSRMAELKAMGRREIQCDLSDGCGQVSLDLAIKLNLAYENRSKIAYWPKWLAFLRQQQTFSSFSSSPSSASLSSLSLDHYYGSVPSAFQVRCTAAEGGFKGMLVLNNTLPENTVVFRSASMRKYLSPAGQSSLWDSATDATLDVIGVSKSPPRMLMAVPSPTISPASFFSPSSSFLSSSLFSSSSSSVSSPPSPNQVNEVEINASYAVLSRNLITALCAHGVPAALFIRLLQQELDRQSVGLTDRTRIIRRLKHSCARDDTTRKNPFLLPKEDTGGSDNKKSITDLQEFRALLLIINDVSLENDLYLTQLLRDLFLQSMLDLKERAAIPVPDAGNFYAVVDPFYPSPPLSVSSPPLSASSSVATIALPENCVFLKVHGKVITGPIAVVRYPLARSDEVRLLEGVNYPHLDFLKDVCVFSLQGKRSALDMMGGGDYDGDKVFCTWNKEIVNVMRKALDATRPKPPPCPSDAKETPLSLSCAVASSSSSSSFDAVVFVPANQQSPSPSSAAFQQEVRKCFYFSTLHNRNNLGILSNAHQAWADLEGFDCWQCHELAAAMQRSLDSLKNGVEVPLPAWIEKAARPYYMGPSMNDRIAIRSSSSIIAQLYDTVVEAERCMSVIPDNTVAVQDEHILYMDKKCRKYGDQKAYHASRSAMELLVAEYEEDIAVYMKTKDTPLSSTGLASPGTGSSSTASLCQTPTKKTKTKRKFNQRQTFAQASSEASAQAEKKFWTGLNDKYHRQFLAAVFSSLHAERSMPPPPSSFSPLSLSNKQQNKQIEDSLEKPSSAEWRKEEGESASALTWRAARAVVDAAERDFLMDQTQWINTRQQLPACVIDVMRLHASLLYRICYNRAQCKLNDVPQQRQRRSSQALSPTHQNYGASSSSSCSSSSSVSSPLCASPGGPFSSAATASTAPRRERLPHSVRTPWELCTALLLDLKSEGRNFDQEEAGVVFGSRMKFVTITASPEGLAELLAR